MSQRPYDWGAQAALQQPAGVFHAGAIPALADIAATAASRRLLDPDPRTSQERFPFSLQLGPWWRPFAAGGP